jgi:Domain of unknown function (DUF222)
MAMALESVPEAPSAPVPPSSKDGYGRYTTAELDRCSDQLFGVHNAALAELFAIVRERSARDEFIADGAKDAAGWLQLRYGLPYPTAMRWAETALALGDLPYLNEAFSSGRICFDKVSVAVEIATPETDAQVADEAARLTVTALRTIARRQREVTPHEEAQAREKRCLWWSWTNGGTMLNLKARLTAEQGARVTAALERTAKQQPTHDQDGPISLTQRRADALDRLAALQISEDADPDRATMMIHVDIETLRTGVGSAWTEEGALLSAETVEKLLCDSRLKALVEDADGKPLGVGRAMRHAPRWMRHAAKVRDKTCCFPGCDNTQFLVPHHLKWWTKDRGPTDLENLPLLCPTHHGLVHSKDWHIEGSPSEGLVFIGPKGTVRDRPPGLDYDVKKWLWEDLYNPSPGDLFDSS